MYARSTTAGSPAPCHTTLIVPDLAVLPGGAARPSVQDRRFFAAVPVRSAEGLASSEGPGVLQGAGVLLADSWRHCLGCEVKHLGPAQNLVIALASVPGEPMTPGSSPEQIDDMERFAVTGDSWPLASGAQCRASPVPSEPPGHCGDGVGGARPAA